MTNLPHAPNGGTAKRLGSVATLGKITAAAVDRAAIAEATGKRLLGTIAQAVSERVGGLCLISVVGRGWPGAISVVVRQPKYPAVEVAPAGEAAPGWLPVGSGTGGAKNERFCFGDLSEALLLAPPGLRAELADRRWGALAILPIRDAGAACGVMVSYRGTEAFRRSEREFLRAARAQTALALRLHETLHRMDAALAAREVFLNLVSHELSGPLATASLHINAIEVNAERPDAAVDATMRSSIHMAKHQLARASALVRRLANVVRYAHHRADLFREELDLAQLIDETIRDLNLQEAGANTIHFDHGTDPVRGRWDRGQLEQVLHNLLGNALKFGGGQPIGVSVAARPEGVVLRVEDHGIGIDPADQQRIFECFARAVPDRQYMGLGLGLWLVREIVSAHGGRVEVHSSPGQGATFEVWLPWDEHGERQENLVTAPAPAASTVPAAIEPSALRL
jgi:signal transduction histidine kinase